VFAPDAIWEAPTLALRYESPESFIETLKATTFETLIQTPPPRRQAHRRRSGPSDDHDPRDEQRCHGDGSALAETGEQLNVDMYGIYYDDVARIDGKWKFTHRRFVPST